METKINLDELYPLYFKLVCTNCKPYLKRLPDEELDDLTQSCWEQIVRKWPTYEGDKSGVSTWITLVCSSTMKNMLRDLNAQKRQIRMHCTSLDSLTNGRNKYL